MSYLVQLHAGGKKYIKRNERFCFEVLNKAEAHTRNVFIVEPLPDATVKCVQQRNVTIKSEVS